MRFSSRTKDSLVLIAENIQIAFRTQNALIFVRKCLRLTVLDPERVSKENLVR